MTLNPVRRKAPQPAAGSPVTTLELFFDLVFVFSVTQLTGLILGSDSSTGYLRAAAVLVVTFWMYDGYAWLSNNVSPTSTSTWLPMLVAMAGFLVMAISVPDVFGRTGWDFAAAYLVVVLLHAWSFSRSTLRGSATAIRRVLPSNLGIVGCLLLAAALGEPLAWIGWATAVVLIVLTVATSSESGFTLRADHFAERHQLIIIIALGETVVATGVAGAGHIDEPLSLAAVLASMALIAALWWVYFGGDDSRARDAFAEVPADRMAHEAMWAYSVAHLLHIAGLVLVAAGLHGVVHTPGSALGLRMALTLAASCSTYLAGEILFRARLRLGTLPSLGVAAAACLPTVGLGTQTTALLQLVGLAAVVVALVVVLEMAERRGPSLEESRLDIRDA